MFGAYSLFAEFLATVNIGDLAVSDDWTLSCNIVDKTVDGTVEYHLCGGRIETSTIIELVVGLLVVGNVKLLSAVHS